MDLEGVRHEGMVVYSASSSKLLINWSDGSWACTDAPGHVLVGSELSSCALTCKVKFGRKNSKTLV